MNQPILLYEASSLRLTVCRRASAAGVALLQQTTYGTSGPQYRHTGQAGKVDRLHQPLFFDLWHGPALAGTYCLSCRLVRTAAGPVPGYYGRYLAVAAAHRGRGYGQLLKDQAVRYVEQRQAAPYLLYSYVEGANERSLRISRAAGFEALGELEAFVFGRLYPRRDPRCGQLRPAEAQPWRQQLEAAYQDYALVHFEHLYDQQHYFVLRENGEIIAGVQANPTRWRIKAMPGAGGWLLLHALPYVPVLRRLLNPHRYEFAALEAAYVQAGRLDALVALLESVLAHFGYTSALLLLDPRAPLAGQLRQSGQLGLLQALKQPVRTQVLAKLHGLTPAQVLGTPARPLYASAFDYT